MSRVSLAAALFAATVSTALVWGDDGAADKGLSDKVIEPAISRPSEERRLAFYAPGVVGEVTVKEGDPVTAGQVLAKQDDSEEQVALRAYQLDANSMAEIDYEKKDQEEKQVVYDRKLRLFNREGHDASQSEVDEAHLAVQLSEAQILVAEQKHDKAVLDAEKQKLKVDHMQLKSPVDGVVQMINTHAGEMADPQNKDGAIIVVKNDPLWVEIHPSAEKALKLRAGQELQVRYAAAFGSEPFPWQTAKVIYFAPKADAGSKTELVRLELPNPTGQKSGLAMEVRLPANVAALATGTPSAPTPGAAGLPPLESPPSNP
jgi:RND family efflux transporter MFP subunit